MVDHWQNLIGNLAVVALFISAWVHGQFVFDGRSRPLRQAAFGAVMGLGAVASMLMATMLEPGVLFDLRSSLIAIASFFGGPIAALVALGFAMVWRAVIGGAGAFPGLVAMVAVAICGLAVSRLARDRLHALMAALILAITSAIVGPLVSVLLRLSGLSSIWAVSTEGMVMTAAATLVGAFFIMRERVVQRERDLLRASFVQSPDYRSVKSTTGQFVAVNEKVAQLYGFDSPAEMVGKTDLDIIEAERARVLMAEEHEIVASGQGFADREELATINGKQAWYSTSKVPLRDAEGEIIGTASVTHDISSRKLMQTDLMRNRNELDYVLSGVSDGIAMFDPQGVLVYRNNQYCSMFPLTSDVRSPGRNIREILHAVLDAGEQIVPKDKQAAWLEEIATSLKQVSEEEVELRDGRLLHVRTRPTAEGAALVVVSDVSKIKQAEAALLSMTGQLKLLATTDGLTGLTNRRAFDEALELELSRCRRNNVPLSLLMIDVDRFKSYNDIYGHQAGDEILKIVATCLKTSLKRPGDIAARYGGEEFVVILPDTDEDGAFFIADAFRASLLAMGLAHPGSSKGVITASVGLACFTERDAGFNATELLRRADEALYIAKGAGRDRVAGWRQRHEVRPVGGMRA